MNRRWFLQLLGAAAAAPFVPLPAAPAITLTEPYGVSFDICDPLELDPGYLFALDQGTQMIESQMNEMIESRYLAPAVEHMREERDRRILEYVSILTDERSA